MYDTVKSMNQSTYNNNTLHTRTHTLPVFLFLTINGLRWNYEFDCDVFARVSSRYRRFPLVSHDFLAALRQIYTPRAVCDIADSQSPCDFGRNRWVLILFDEIFYLEGRSFENDG